MPRPLSDSWRYFELLAPDNGRSRKARCTFCGHEQAAGITRLHQHLLYRCSRITSDIRDQLRQKQDDRGRDSSPKGNELLHHNHHHQNLQHQQESVDYHFDSTALQNTLNNNNNNNNHHSPPNVNPHPSYYEAALSPTTSTNFSTATSIAFPPSSNTNTTSTTLGQQQQQQQQQRERSQAILDCQLARALFSAKIPFESIENPHLIDFLKRLQPNYIVPKGRRLQQFLLKEQHWDLIQWDNNEPDLMLPTTNTSNHPPPVMHSPPMLQQQQQRSRMMLSSDNTNNNNTGNNNASNAMGNRLLSSLHPPADLEGSL